MLNDKLLLIFCVLVGIVILCHRCSFTTNYRPPMKLQEGNFFSHVCLSVCSQGVPIWLLPMMYWTLPYRDPLPPGPGLLQTRNLTVYCDQIWTPVQTCSHEDSPSTGADIWRLLKLERTVGMRTVCIQLECFLVLTFNLLMRTKTVSLQVVQEKNSVMTTDSQTANKTQAAEYRFIQTLYLWSLE